MRSTIAFLALATTWAFTTAASAGLIITSADSTVRSGGGIAVVPVYVSSDSSDNLGSFTVIFDITNGSNAITPVATLEFVSPTSAATDPTLIAPGYVYAGTGTTYPNFPDMSSSATVPISSNVATSSTFGVATSPVDPVAGPFTGFSGADSDNLNDVLGAVTLSSTPVLLANLVVQYNAPSTTNTSGDNFVININLSTSSFTDGSGSPLTVETTNPAIAKIHVTNPVPEPSTIVMIASSALFAGFLSTCRRGKAIIA